MRYIMTLILMLLTQAILSAIGETIMSLADMYFYVTAFGCSAGLTGIQKTLKFGFDSSTACFAGSLLLMGAGVGLVFQPSFLAI